MFAHAEYLGLLGEPSMYRHGLGTQETERLNTSHMDDMINMLMFTIEATSSHVMIGFGVVNLDRLHLTTMRDVVLSGSSLVIRLKHELIIINIV